MIDINSIVAIEPGPNNFAQIYPFTIRVRVPARLPLSSEELEMVHEAIARLAFEIRIMRNNKACFAWAKDGAINWIDSPK